MKCVIGCGVLLLVIGLVPGCDRPPVPEGVLVYSSDGEVRLRALGEGVDSVVRAFPWVATFPGRAPTNWGDSMVVFSYQYAPRSWRVVRSLYRSDGESFVTEGTAPCADYATLHIAYYGTRGADSACLVLATLSEDRVVSTEFVDSLPERLRRTEAWSGVVASPVSMGGRGFVYQGRDNALWLSEWGESRRRRRLGLLGQVPVAAFPESGLILARPEGSYAELVEFSVSRDAVVRQFSFKHEDPLGWCYSVDGAQLLYSRESNSPTAAFTRRTDLWILDKRSGARKQLASGVRMRGGFIRGR